MSGGGDSLGFIASSLVFVYSLNTDGGNLPLLSLPPPHTQSLFHRVSLDPLEKEWLKSCAVGNMAAQGRLLAQEPGLVLKKVRFRSRAPVRCSDTEGVI